MCCYRIAHLLNILNSSCEIGIRDIAVSTVPFSILKDVKDIFCFNRSGCIPVAILLCHPCFIISWMHLTVNIIKMFFQFFFCGNRYRHTCSAIFDWNPSVPFRLDIGILEFNMDIFFRCFCVDIPCFIIKNDVRVKCHDFSSSHIRK